ncbi:MAG: M48 family metalloprotease [Candidatus Methylacidiphilales bacterium]
MKNIIWLAFGIWMAGSVHAQFGLDRLDPYKMAEGAVKVTKGAGGVGIQEEMSIGGSVAVEIAAMHGGIWKNEEATRRLNLIGKSLARYSDRPTLPFRFAILESETVNGFSAPGGYVFITKGAYQAAESDDQLAGILAHEIAHVTRRHALRIISRSEMISGLADVAAGTSGDYAQYDFGVDKVSNTLLKTGYDSGTEYDADRMGRELAANTGYDRDGLLKFLQKLEAMGLGERGAFSTHPPLKERIRRLGGS